MEDEAYFKNCTAAIQKTRDWTAKALEELDFTVLPSKANFIFAASKSFPNGELYRKLKENGILVRWFDQDRIRDFYRITIGSAEQMEQMVEAIKKLLGEM